MFYLEWRRIGYANFTLWGGNDEEELYSNFSELLLSHLRTEGGQLKIIGDHGRGLRSSEVGATKGTLRL